MIRTPTNRMLFAVGLGMTLALPAIPVSAQTNPWGPEFSKVPVTVEVMPMAEIDFPNGTGGLHLYVPPANSTVPSSGVEFVVRGNAMAWVSATPAEFLRVSPYFLGNTNLGPKYLGRAALPDGSEIGYDIQVVFPIGTTRSLPLTNGQGTPPVAVDMTDPDPSVIGSSVTGFLHLVANHRWTPDATMPATGDYTGEIIVTVGAAPL